MSEPELRTCVRLNCDRRGEPTTDERCPACDFPTRPMAEFRPDPSQMQLDQENDDARTVTLPALGLGTQDPMPVLTTSDFPGRTIYRVIGDVIGTAHWSWGQDHLYPRAQPTDSEVLITHAIARERMIREARKRHADAIIGLRYNDGTPGVGHSVIAYGTAVALVED